MKDIFVDTSYFIALVNKSDDHHSKAKNWAMQIKEKNITCHITIPVVFEIADGFSKTARREIGIDLIEKMSSSDNFVIHFFDDTTYEKALNLYKSRKDKEWGLTDCYSFELMKQLNLLNALTADKHFEQYGCQILLK